MANDGTPDAEPGYAQPPRRPRRAGPVVVLAVLAVLAVGGGTALYLLGSADAPPSAVVVPTGSAASLPNPEFPATTLAPESSADPRFVQVGQCVRNDGPAGGRPRLLITDCAPRTYEVLRRFDGPASGEEDAEAKCADVTGYTDWYFFNSELDSLDFVLCLKLR